MGEPEKLGSGSFYSILGVGSESSMEDIRRAYRRLAMRWHPDRWARSSRSPSQLSEAKAKFQKIQEAYSDQRKRAKYDTGLYSHEDDEDDEAFYDFMQEMASLMAQVKTEVCMEELKTMFMEMAQRF